LLAFEVDKTIDILKPLTMNLLKKSYTFP
jgi:hypothetical protein